MAKSRPNKARPATPPSATPEQALKHLRMQRQKGQALIDKGTITEAEEQAWETAIEETLRRTFGSDSPNIGRLQGVGAYALYGGGTQEQYAAQRIQDMKDRLAIIDELIELVATDVPSHEAIDAPAFGHVVFLVHGHNEPILHQTARFIETLDLELIVLREQPNKGRTIIEKFGLLRKICG